MGQRLIVAVGLLTDEDLQVLGSSFNRLWPVDETPCFAGLLEAIDDADRQLWRSRDDNERQQDEMKPAAGPHGEEAYRQP